MRRDVLAAGAKSAKFAGGIGETDVTRNLMSEEDRAAAEAADRELVKVEHESKPRLVFRPRGTTILVRRITVEELSTVLITETIEKEKPAEGTVLEIGPKVVDIQRNDRVVFGKYAGTEFKVNGEVLLIMDQEDVKGTLEPEQTITSVTGAWTGTVPAGCIVAQS